MSADIYNVGCLNLLVVRKFINSVPRMIPFIPVHEVTLLYAAYLYVSQIKKSVHNFVCCVNVLENA